MSNTKPGQKATQSGQKANQKSTLGKVLARAQEEIHDLKQSLKLQELKSKLNTKVKGVSEKVSARVQRASSSLKMAVKPGGHAMLARMAHARPDLVKVPLPANRPVHSRDQTETICHRFAFAGQYTISTGSKLNIWPTPCDGLYPVNTLEGNIFCTLVNADKFVDQTTTTYYKQTNPDQWSEPGYPQGGSLKHQFQLASGYMCVEITPTGLGTASVSMLDSTMNPSVWSYSRPNSDDTSVEFPTDQDNACWVTPAALDETIVYGTADTVHVSVGKKLYVIVRIPASLSVDWYEHQSLISRGANTAAEPNCVPNNFRAAMLKGLGILRVLSHGADVRVAIQGFYDIHTRVRGDTLLVRAAASGSVPADPELIDVNCAGSSIGMGETLQQAFSDAAMKDAQEEIRSGRHGGFLDTASRIPILGAGMRAISSMHIMPKDVNSYGISPSVVFGGVAAAGALAGAGELAYKSLSKEQRESIRKTASDATAGAGRLLDGVMNLAGTAGDGLNGLNKGIRSVSNLLSHLF